jgi:hypothetical protein
MMDDGKREQRLIELAANGGAFGYRRIYALMRAKASRSTISASGVCTEKAGLALRRPRLISQSTSMSGRQRS